MEALWVSAGRMPEPTHVATEDEVERLDLLGVGFAGVERCERLHDVRAAHSDAAHGDALFKAQWLRW